MKKTHFLAVFVLFAAVIAQSQTTAIPDNYFEQALIDLGIDSDGTVNGEVLTADIESVTELDVSSAGISDLTGIEDFEALEVLYVGFNGLEEVDLSNNTQLKDLDVTHNELTDLDLSNNILLEKLYAGNDAFDDEFPQNYFETIDLSANINLRVLDVEAAFLSELDLSANELLEDLRIPFTDLETIDLSINTNLKWLNLGYYTGIDAEFYRSNPHLKEVDLSSAVQLTSLVAKNTYLETIKFKNGNNDIPHTVYLDENPDLVCIEVDDPTAATNGTAPYDTWDVDPWVTYAEDCSLGVNETPRLSVAVYPNPTSSTVTITTGSAVLQEVRVYTTTGKEVLRQKSNTNVDLSALAPGVYFLDITTDLGRQVEKIVKE